MSGVCARFSFASPHSIVRIEMGVHMDNHDKDGALDVEIWLPTWCLGKSTNWLFARFPRVAPSIRFVESCAPCAYLYRLLCEW